MDLSSLSGSGTSGSTLVWSRADNWCEYDSCVYFKQNDDPTYKLLYVDDMLIGVRNKVHIQKLKIQLKKEFDIKDLGEAKKIFGMKITWDRTSGKL